MSNIQNIIDKIIEDAELTAKEIQAEAEEKAAEIKGKAQKAGDKKAADIAAMYERECQEEKTRFLATSDLELRKDLLSAKQEVLDEVFKKVYEDLLALDDAKFLELSEKMVKQAVKSGTEVIRASANDVKLIDKKFVDGLNAEIKGGKLTLDSKTADIGDDRGFVIILGGVEINCTMKNLVKQAKEEMESEVSQILFAGDLT